MVISIERTENLWVVKTKEKSFYTKNLILATGIIGNPYIPTIPELNQYQGKVIHSTQFKNWKEYRNKKVLIVGCGNTASDIASELAQNNIKVDVSIRDGNYVFPLTLLKIPIQYYVILLDKCPKVILLFLANIISKIFIILSKLKIKSKQEHFTKNIIPKPSVGILDKTPMIGTEFSYLVNRGKINIQKVIIASSKEEITFTDGTSHKYDQIILATGYRPDISYAKEYLDCHEFGFLRKDYVRSPSHDSLFFIGFNYSLTGALQNLKRDSRLVSDFILSRY